MLEKVKAAGYHVIVVRDEVETEKDGLLLPELDLKKPNTGKIISMGEEVVDKYIESGKTAVFHKSAGNPIQLFGQEITVLIQNDNQQQVLAVF